MGRRKKEVKKPQRRIKIEKINPETVKLSEEPSMEFCKSCESTDLRVTKENMNKAVITLHMVAIALDITYDDLDMLCSKVKKWANHTMNENRTLLLRKGKE